MEAENYWVGTEKKRYNFVLKYVGGNITGKGYSVHKFEDREGRKLMAYSDYAPDQIPIEWPSSPLPKKLIEGDCFTCKASVLRHSINDFKVEIPFKETVLNRIKFGEYLGRNSGN